MAAILKSKDRDIERQISEAINDAKCLDLNASDSGRVLELINEYLGDGVDSDDEDVTLTPEEKADFYDHEEDESDDDHNEDQDSEEEEEEIEEMDIDSDEEENFLVIEPGTDVILANGDPEFMSEDDQKVY